MVYIITSKPNEIGKQIMNEIESGVTYLHGTGGWTGDEKKVIFCVVRRTQGPQVEELVKDGHLIGNHSYHHVQLNKLSIEEATGEIEKTNRLIREWTGEAPRVYPPTVWGMESGTGKGGGYDPGILECGFSGLETAE